MGFYLGTTGKILLASLAASAVSAVIESRAAARGTAPPPRSKMTPEWKASVEDARRRGDVRSFMALFRSINPSMAEDDILHCWDVLGR